jgi:hypothetical protein
MKLSEKRFRSAITRAGEYVAHKQSFLTAVADADSRNQRRRILLSQPARTFLDDLVAPTSLDPDLLARHLVGAGHAPNLWALLHWPGGTPVVKIVVHDPIEAIGVSIQMDRNFSKRRWVVCTCGDWFERQRSTDRFCSKKCRNSFTTTRRRRKIKLVEQGDEAWKLLAPKKRKGRDRCVWIAEWAGGKGKSKFDPVWVRRELRSAAIGGRC